MVDVQHPGEDIRYGGIMVTDVEQFSRADRADTDRGRIRSALQAVLDESLRAIGLPPESCLNSETGDGLALILPPDFPKKDMLLRLYPEIENRLRDRNDTVEPAERFRIRMVLNHGDVYVDSLTLSGPGIHGTPLTDAFRLLDTSNLRQALAELPPEFPIALFVTQRFYDEVVMQQLPVMVRRLRRFQITTKSGVMLAWFLEPERVALGGAGLRQLSRSDTSGKRRVTLADLTGKCLYVPTCDIHNYSLYYGLLRSTVPLVNHLETALLLADHAILHCADPYRSSVVYEALSEFRSFVEDGSLLFLLGSSVNDIRSDYPEYISDKAREYLSSRHGESDLESLNRPLEEGSSSLERAIDLLDLSPVLLHRGFSGTAAFHEAVDRDLGPTEKLATFALPPRKLLRVNLTLYQIAHLQRASHDGASLQPLLGDSSRIEDVLDQIQLHVQSRFFSRRILLDIFDQEFGAVLHHNSTLRSMLETRINLLHLHANIGSYSFIELTPKRDEDSPYYYRHLISHIGSLSGVGSFQRFGVGLIKTLREMPEWWSFVNYHLGLMAEAYARRLADVPSRPDYQFRRASERGVFDQIRQTIIRYL